MRKSFIRQEKHKKIDQKKKKQAHMVVHLSDFFYFKNMEVSFKLA